MKTIRVKYFQHPIERNRSNVTVVEVPFRRQTLAQLKKQIAPNQDVHIGLDSRQVMPDMWSKIRLSPDSGIVFVPAAADPVTFGYSTWTAFFVSTAINIAIAYGLSYLGGKLFGPDMKQPDEMPAGQSFSWNPHTTRRRGDPRPLCWGKNMHYGNIVARWTDVDGSGDEILYMIIDGGEGPIQGRTGTVYIDGQPSTNFPGVTIQERLGTTNQSCMTGFEKLKLEYRPQEWKITNSGGALIWTSPNNFFDDLEYTFAFLQGLWYRHKSGDLGTMSINMKVEISVHDADSWTTLFNSSISGLQFEPLYKIYRVSEQGFSCVHGNQYDLRFTRVSSDSTSERVSDEIWLRSVREVVNVAFTRPRRVLLGITALATSNLSGDFDVKWESEDKLVYVYNGTSWSIEYSNNRAWVALSELTQPIFSGDGSSGSPYVLERYEGINPSRLDLAFFYEWAEWCDDQVTDGNGGTENRMPCDIIVDYASSVWSLMYEIAQIGRMYPYWQGNTLTGWLDKAETDVTDLVTFDNVMLRSWKSVWGGYGESAGGVEVFYQDALHGYERKSRPIPNEESGDYTRVVSIEGIGVKSHTLATRVGNHALQRSKLIKNLNTVRMYKDALRYRLGQVVRLQSTVPNWGVPYRVTQDAQSSGNTVELDRTCTASPGDIVYLRSYDEINERIDISSYTVDSVSGNELTIVETWDVTPVKNNILAIGIAGAIKLRRIIKMNHSADNYFEVEFETYAATLYNSDSIDPQFTNPDYVWPQPSAPIVKPATPWNVLDMISKAVTPQVDVDSPITSNCTWSGNSVDTVSWAKTDSAEPIIFRYKGNSYEITPDSTTDEFIYWDPSYTTIFRTTNDASTAVTLGKWYMCRNVAGVAYPTNPFSSVHAGVLQAGTITAAYGQIADAAITTAKIADAQITEAKIGSLAVTVGKIGSLAVTTAKIDSLAVTTLKIADDATAINESIYTAAQTTVTTTETTVQSDSITSQGGLIEISATIDAEADAGDVWFTVRIYEGSTLLAYKAEAVSSGYTKAVTLNATRYTGSGSQNFYVKAIVTSGAASFKAGSRGLYLRESLGK